MDLQMYDGMDLDLKDYVVEGKYALQITAFDPNFVSAEKQTAGIEVRATIVDGPAQDDKGTSPQGASTSWRMWYPKPTQKDGGMFCKKRINAFLDACGLHEKRQALGAGGPAITDADVIGCVIVAKAEIDESGNEPKNEWSKFAPYVGGEA